ncbi:MAG: hypothetical protein DME98_05545 [Verrucomicrobia bacterium]|nr:MAG: hypothetical protein DME98_05545 [Verrucomicrobiota bacterium]PYJ33932.1 MAG: hypothetical protein DME88_06890 [Verrucomicrobiota bacterium]
MRTKLSFFAGAVFATVGHLGAGSMELAPKETAPPSITQSEPWQFTIAVPGWLASFNGTIGIRGVNANIDVPVTEVLQHFDAILAGRVEAQKGPFGIFGEAIYMGLSDVTQINGLINNIHETVDLTYVDGALSWRLVNQPRWFLNFAAGTHYTTVYEQLELHSDPILIQQTSKQFVDNIADDLRDRLNKDISNSEFLAALKGTIEADIVSRIDKHNLLERHESKPRIPIGPLGGRIEEDVAQRVENFIEKEKAALEARIDALRLMGAARRAAVARAVNAAKARIANQLALRLDKSLSQTLSKDDYWFDPYVGLRARYNFNRTFYTAVRGEIGGFGVGADLMWEVETVVGINLTRSIFTEIGYRALGADYENNGLLFDAVLHGPQITTGITF